MNDSPCLEEIGLLYLFSITPFLPHSLPNFTKNCQRVLPGISKNYCQEFQRIIAKIQGVQLII